MNVLFLVLLGLISLVAVVTCLIAARRSAGQPASRHPGFNRRPDSEPSDLKRKLGAPGISKTKEREPANYRRNDRHILFVEDDRHFAESGRTTLKELGYQVTLVADANEALAVIHNAHEKIDCVVTDLSMPGMSGFDLARVCQRLLPDVPVILMSSLDGPIADELLHTCGIHGLLSKPFARQTLAEAVKRVLTGGKDLD
jgi:CheY-like chemotaxis protein